MDPPMENVDENKEKPESSEISRNTRKHNVIKSENQRKSSLFIQNSGKNIVSKTDMSKKSSEKSLKMKISASGSVTDKKLVGEIQKPKKKLSSSVDSAELQIKKKGNISTKVLPSEINKTLKTVNSSNNVKLENKSTVKKQEIIAQQLENKSTIRKDGTVSRKLENKLAITKKPEVKLNAKVIKGEPSKSHTSKLNSKTSRLAKADEKSARIGISNKVDKNKIYSENTKKNLITNVTINSPILNRKENLSVSVEHSEYNAFTKLPGEISIDSFGKEKVLSNITENPDSNKEKEDKFKHKRFRTRTLEPEEIKIIKREADNNSNDIEMKKLVQQVKGSYNDNDQHVPLIGKPKAFYVDLKENLSLSTNQSGSHLPISKSKMPSPTVSESDSVNYEDDFESYASDFESFNSSSHNETNSELISFSLDNSEQNQQSDSVSVDNESIYNTQTNIQDEETNLDSGNFDLREMRSGKIFEMKMNHKEETATEVNDFPYALDKSKEISSSKQISYTDEGFDENSGGFSSTSNCGSQKPDDTMQCISNSAMSISDFNTLSKKKKLRKYYQQRARDLCSLITLDEIEYSLFEINPIPYDIFIKTFGKSNFLQGSSQTNDDYVSEMTQTDLIFTDNKWTQNPVEFSKFDICMTSVKDSKPKRPSLDLYMEDETFHRMSLKTGKIEIQRLENPLEIYYRQRLGSNVQTLEFNKDIGQNLVTDHKTLAKMYNFVQKVGKVMIEYLNSESSNIDANDTLKSDFLISNTYIVPLRNLSNISYLKNRPPVLASFTDDTINCFLTVHDTSIIKNTYEESSQLKKDSIYSRSIICIWQFQRSIPAEPTKVLACINDVSCCRLSGGLSGVVVAGLQDGTVSAWDLKEEEMWHNLVRDSNDNVNKGFKHTADTSILSKNTDLKDPIDYPVLRCPSFNSCNMDLNSDTQESFWAGPVVDVLFFKPRKQMSQGDVQVVQESVVYDQVCSLQKYGLLTIWTIINQTSFSSDNLKEAHFKMFINDHNSAYWSKLALHKSLVIDLKSSIGISLGTAISTTKLSIPETNGVLYPSFPLTDVHRRNSLKKKLRSKVVLDIVRKSEADEKKNLIIDKLNVICQSDPTLKNRIFGDVETDIYSEREETNSLTGVSKSIPDEQLKAGIGFSTWQLGLTCNVVKYIQDFNNEGHFLIACNGGKVMHYLQRGYPRDPHIFFCSDDAASVNAIEICPHDLLYFLVSCEDHSMYLCSLNNSRPLKTFFNKFSIQQLENPQKELVGLQKEEIICVQWSKIRPCLFIALSRQGRLTVWDLIKSDLVPVVIEKINSNNDVKEITLVTGSDEKNRFKKEFLVLIFISGKIEIHKLCEDIFYLSSLSDIQEKNVLGKYFELL